jgi:hypothetical protein
MGLRERITLGLSLLVLFGAFGQVLAQGGAPKFEVDPTWPKPLPENWVTGQVSGVCVDNQDHVFIVNRNNISAKEAEVSRQAPPFIEFDADGKVVNGFGDWETAPNTTHGCIIDHENNFWTAGKCGCWWCIYAGRALRSSWERRTRVRLRPAGRSNPGIR